MNVLNIKCPVCGTEYEGDTLVDPCPVCDWVYDYTEEDPKEKSGANPISLEKAKEYFAKGLNIWGEPLPKK